MKTMTPQMVFLSYSYLAYQVIQVAELGDSLWKARDVSVCHMGEVGSSVPGQHLSLKILVGAVEGVRKRENHHFGGVGNLQ